MVGRSEPAVPVTFSPWFEVGSIRLITGSIGSLSSVAGALSVGGAVTFTVSLGAPKWGTGVTGASRPFTGANPALTDPAGAVTSVTGAFRTERSFPITGSLGARVTVTGAAWAVRPFTIPAPPFFSLLSRPRLPPFLLSTISLSLSHAETSVSSSEIGSNPWIARSLAASRAQAISAGSVKRFNSFTPVISASLSFSLCESLCVARSGSGVFSRFCIVGSSGSHSGFLFTEPIGLKVLYTRSTDAPARNNASAKRPAVCAARVRLLTGFSLLKVPLLSC